MDSDFFREAIMEQFKPAWWLPGPHLQTIWPTLIKRKVIIPFTRERFELKDGDFVDLFWCGKGNSPILLILHGLEGSSQSHYVFGLAQAMVNRGWRAVAMEFRGCSQDPNRLTRRYHSGDTGDMEEVLLAIQQREPNTPLCAVGFSLGGNVLLKWLGESDNQPIKAAAAISVPFELAQVSSQFDKGFSKIYRYQFLKSLKKSAKKIVGIEKTGIDLTVLNQIKSLKDFDRLITAPLHGFIDDTDYYQRCSSRAFLSTIKIPTLILHAKDDPFIAADCIPNSDELSPFVKLELQEQGGHLGFISGTCPWRSVYWLEQRIPEYFVGIL